jgi:hypothetical protein
MPNVLVSVKQRPPTRPDASSITNRRPEAAIRRAAAIPAAPAPTITTSVSPEAGKAASAGEATVAAERARKERRFNRAMVSECFPKKCTMPKMSCSRKLMANAP